MVPVHDWIVGETIGSTTRGRRPEDELVVTVDEAGRPAGTMPKLAAHEGAGVLHRAFSVFLFDDDGRVLLQRRADDKHHFRGRWSNTCCSHPLPGESVTEAASRRLSEELGIEAEAREVGSFTYRAQDPDSGLVEVEFDHVLVGRHQGEIAPDPAEVGAVRWMDVDELRRTIATDPDAFTPWLPLALDVLDANR